ncbi:MAG: hypothetical protein A4E64_00174 [Syntrophorhabdus sp. PtaU1.Bin058]|nr:MAG: hypothetical protein A4E64_00174 [Syntrophorhabdus sp. PtaU1.Bin058]
MRIVECEPRIVVFGVNAKLPLLLRVDENRVRSHLAARTGSRGQRNNRQGHILHLAEPPVIDRIPLIGLKGREAFCQIEGAAASDPDKAVQVMRFKLCLHLVQIIVCGLRHLTDEQYDLSQLGLQQFYDLLNICVILIESAVDHQPGLA